MASKLVFGWSNFSMALLLLAAVVASLAISSANGAKINISNRCSFTITACATCCGGRQVSCYVLRDHGGSHQIDVGGNWPAGVIWGFPGSGNPSIGNNAKPQANLAELTIGANGNDYYDISNVDAYNLPMRVGPLGGNQLKTPHCGTINCIINDIGNFCRAPNFLTGPPGNGCKNANGPGLVATDGTLQFKKRCPNSYSYSKDDKDTVFGCETGHNYEVVFCPDARSMIQEVVETN